MEPTTPPSKEVKPLGSRPLPSKPTAPRPKTSVLASIAKDVHEDRQKQEKGPTLSSKTPLPASTNNIQSTDSLPSSTAPLSMKPKAPLPKTPLQPSAPPRRKTSAQPESTPSETYSSDVHEASHEDSLVVSENEEDDIDISNSPACKLYIQAIYHNKLREVRSMVKSGHVTLNTADRVRAIFME